MVAAPQPSEGAVQPSRQAAGRTLGRMVGERGSGSVEGIRHVAARTTPGGADTGRLPFATTLVAVTLAQLADGITFVRMIADHGLGAERNPLVAHLAAGSDPWAMLVVKLLLTVEVVGIAALLGRSHPRVGALVVTVAVAGGLLGAFSNLAVLLAG